MCSWQRIYAAVIIHQISTKASRVLAEQPAWNCVFIVDSIHQFDSDAGCREHNQYGRWQVGFVHQRWTARIRWGLVVCLLRFDEHLSGGGVAIVDKCMLNCVILIYTGLAGREGHYRTTHCTLISAGLIDKRPSTAFALDQIQCHLTHDDALSSSSWFCFVQCI